MPNPKWAMNTLYFVGSSNFPVIKMNKPVQKIDKKEKTNTNAFVGEIVSNWYWKRRVGFKIR